jgi:hypothetical protein
MEYGSPGRDWRRRPRSGRPRRYRCGIGLRSPGPGGMTLRAVMGALRHRCRGHRYGCQLLVVRLEVETARPSERLSSSSCARRRRCPGRCPGRKAEDGRGVQVPDCECHSSASMRDVLGRPSCPRRSCRRLSSASFPIAVEEPDADARAEVPAVRHSSGAAAVWAMPMPASRAQQRSFFFMFNSIWSSSKKKVHFGWKGPANAMPYFVTSWF